MAFFIDTVVIVTLDRLIESSGEFFCSEKTLSGDRASKLVSSSL
jgi:hypothetical protein